MVFWGKRSRGLTLFELMTVVTIMMIAAVVASTTTGRSWRRYQMVNQLKLVKSNFTRARAKAMEMSAPVRFTFDPNDNSILAVMDTARTGAFEVNNLRLIAGVEVDSGDPSPYDKIIPMTGGWPPLAHWSGLSHLGSLQPFPNNQFIILPDGRIMAGNPMVETSGTFFFQTDPTDRIGAVHITAMGESKMAIQDLEGATGASSAWRWTE